jgi:hypothetical protein
MLPPNNAIAENPLHLQKTAGGRADQQTLVKKLCVEEACKGRLLSIQREMKLSQVDFTDFLGDPKLHAADVTGGALMSPNAETGSLAAASQRASSGDAIMDVDMAVAVSSAASASACLFDT